MSERPTSRPDDIPAETGVQALLAMIVTVAAGAVAYAWGGLVWALLVLLVMAAVVTVTQTLLRARHVAQGLESRRWVDVSGMSSEQAAKVLSALSTSGDAVPMPTSEVLTEIARARDRCREDAVALAIELEALRERWPRSPAVLGELARAHATAGRSSKAAELYTAAIREGRRTGTFAWILATLSRDEVMALELGLLPEEWDALATLATARSEPALAERLRVRTASASRGDTPSAGTAGGEPATHPQSEAP